MAGEIGLGRGRHVGCGRRGTPQGDGVWLAPGLRTVSLRFHLLYKFRLWKALKFPIHHANLEEDVGEEA